MSLMDQLQPMFKASPKHANNTLAHAAIRDVLHRFFMSRGWFMHGFQEKKSSEGPKKEAPVAQNVDLFELSVIAATMEDMAHKETKFKLEGILHGKPWALSNDFNDETVTIVL